MHKPELFKLFKQLFGCNPSGIISGCHWCRHKACDVIKSTLTFELGCTIQKRLRAFIMKTVSCGIPHVFNIVCTFLTQFRKINLNIYKKIVQVLRLKHRINRNINRYSCYEFQNKLFLGFEGYPTTQSQQRTKFIFTNLFLVQLTLSFKIVSKNSMMSQLPHCSTAPVKNSTYGFILPKTNAPKL